MNYSPEVKQDWMKNVEIRRMSTCGTMQQKTDTRRIHRVLKWIDWLVPSFSFRYCTTRHKVSKHYWQIYRDGFGVMSDHDFCVQISTPLCGSSLPSAWLLVESVHLSLHHIIRNVRLVNQQPNLDFPYKIFLKSI